MSPSPLRIFTEAFLQAGLRLSTDDVGRPLDERFGLADIAPEVRRILEQECSQFHTLAGSLLDPQDSILDGIRFWQSRNHDKGSFQSPVLFALANRFGPVYFTLRIDGKVVLL